MFYKPPIAARCVTTLSSQKSRRVRFSLKATCLESFNISHVCHCEKDKLHLFYLSHIEMVARYLLLRPHNSRQSYHAYYENKYVWNIKVYTIGEKISVLHPFRERNKLRNTCRILAENTRTFLHKWWWYRIELHCERSLELLGIDETGNC